MKEVKILQVQGDVYYDVHKSFEENLNACLKEGWEMSGNMSVVSVQLNGNANLVYSQKLVKEIKEIKEKPLQDMFRS